jgi:exodeoxyribonuclease VII small subunit|tara:strand:+ start:4101 stop:4280 length:180 start_codon:yes stop_codon:yes gene_type:complete
MSFERGIKEVQEIVDKLEGNEIDLEESMNLFEKAQKIIKYCNKQLKNAEDRIKEITETK